MRIRLWDRLILLFGALMALLCGLLLVFWGAGLLVDNASLWQAVSLALGILSLCLCALLITLFRRFSQKRHAFVVQHTDNGELRIAVSAIESLVKKCIDMHEEIHVNRMQIRHSREGVTVDLSIALAHNISIPLAVASLQKQIKQYLVASSGIDVKEVRVCVESTQTDATDNSPYLVTDTAPIAAPSPIETVNHDEKKMPLHRRLFGKADQAATVPEPPKPQEIMEEMTAEEFPAPEEAVVAPAAEYQEVSSLFDESTPISAEITPAEDANDAPLLAQLDQEKEEENLG